MTNNATPRSAPRNTSPSSPPSKNCNNQLPEKPNPNPTKNNWNCFEWTLFQWLAKISRPRNALFSKNGSIHHTPDCNCIAKSADLIFFFARLKQYRALAARYDQRAVFFSAPFTAQPSSYGSIDGTPWVC
ncbi:hypothetical protein JXA32_01270 [Candidatus Sumerlaeota bacterium]|nr:hypothetical protein [Candidatus Sumerlaeota bacterium]